MIQEKLENWFQEGSNYRRLASYLSREKPNLPPSIDSEDIIQDAICKAIRASGKASEYKGESSLNSWLTSIGLNTAKDSYRRARRFESLDSDQFYVQANQIQSSANSIEDIVSWQDTFQKIKKIMAGVVSDKQLGYLIAYGEGMSYPEIASMFEVNPTTVKSSIHHARKKLKESELFPEVIKLLVRH